MGFTPTDTGNTDVFTISHGVATHLTLPDGFGSASARGINDVGVIVGNHTDGTTGHLVGYLRDSAGLFTSFSATQETTTTLANGINNNGTIVGSYMAAGGSFAGYERAADGTITLLATPTTIGGLAVTSITYQGINDLGVTAGTFLSRGGSLGSSATPPTTSPRSSSRGGTVQDTVTGINDSGTVAGTYIDAGGTCCTASSRARWLPTRAVVAVADRSRHPRRDRPRPPSAPPSGRRLNQRELTSAVPRPDGPPVHGGGPGGPSRVDMAGIASVRAVRQPQGVSGS
jgi:hypothetical protein